MVQRTADEIRAAVSAAYGARARKVAAGSAQNCCVCCDDAQAENAPAPFYSAEEKAGMPDTAVSYGCGNPVAMGTLQPGEVVLDLGSGAGLDCFLAARQVGPEGRVIGLDMTDEMLALAERNRATLGVQNVEFRKGVMEALPLDDASVDVIISNCVINLSPDKDAVFREAFRVLAPGGRLHISDVVLPHPLSPAEQDDLDLWAGCLSGALEREDYARRLAAAGFVEVKITLVEPGEEGGQQWRSALIEARKPGVGPRPARPRRGEPIDLVAAPGLEIGAVCTIDEDGTPRCC